MWRLIHRIPPAVRLATSLALITASLFVGLASIGLGPETPRSDIARRRLAEGLGVQLAMAAGSGPEALHGLADMMRERHSELKSMAVRLGDGTTLFTTDGHGAAWGEGSPDPGDRPTGTHHAVPISEPGDDGVRAQVEFVFEPLPPRPWLGVGWPLPVALTLLGLGAYWIHISRVLAHLDPNSVIPERVKAMLDTMSEGVLVVDERHRIVLANEVFLAASGTRLADLQGRRVEATEWLARASFGAGERPWQAVMRDGRPSRGVECRIPGDDGQERVYIVNATPILGVNGQCRGAMATFDDLTEVEAQNKRLEEMVTRLDEARARVQRQNQELEALATRDELTGCLNRRALHDRFEAVWTRATADDGDVACIMLDIDHFKSVNDEHGHAAGDAVLREVASRLRAGVPDGAILGRYGGEEFCVVLPDGRSDAAVAVAEGLRTSIDGSPIEGLDVSVSLGVADRAFGAADGHELIDHADQALYAAKRSGRNRVCRRDELPEAIDAATPEAAPKASRTDARTPAPSPAPDVEIPVAAVRALEAALARRDATTADHSRRVGAFGARFALRLGLPARQVHVVEVAGLLHDVGKLGVPDAILLKPGSLTREEWAVMDAQQRFGVEILEGAFKSVELTEIVRNLRARWDGEGAEPGLPTGVDVPLGARILTIVDAFDAMTTDRPYRPGRSPEEAIDEIERLAGTQFDPDLVARFTEFARDPGFLERGPAAEQVAVELGRTVEGLVGALDRGDLAQLGALAERLAGVARHLDWGDVADLAGEVRASVGHDRDPARLVATARDLIATCESRQSEALGRPRTDA